MKKSKLIKILPEETCDELVSELQTSTEWVDGKGTTGLYLKKKKTNLELKPDSETFQKVVQEFMEKYNTNPRAGKELMSKRVISMIVNRYAEGGKYGGHYDQEFMSEIGTGEPIRSDYSFTIFLNDNFEGGKLKIGNETVTPKKGYGCFYESGIYHSVTEVKTNERFAIVGWIESLIKDHEIREAIVLIENILSHHVNNKTLEERVYKDLNRAKQIISHKFL